VRSDPKIPSFKDNPRRSVPALLQNLSARDRCSASIDPALHRCHAAKSQVPIRETSIRILLSLCLALFLADAVVSLADDS